ncbi:helix-turn-helix domain-containing protein [Pseudarthrobacter humi]|uniref:helix-turn-helix domain-containing protein n=1 Tax=Pseudarthrobacter humi TaxID=2952523 RepID=UPI0035560058
MDSALHDTTKLVGLKLWTYTDSTCGKARPGHKRLAEDLGKSERTVKTHMGILRDEGWIVRTSKPNNNPNRGWADVYALQLPVGVQSGLHSNGGMGSPDAVGVQFDANQVQLEADQVQPELHSNKPFTSNPLQQGAGPPTRGRSPANSSRRNRKARAAPASRDQFPQESSAELSGW